METYKATLSVYWGNSNLMKKMFYIMWIEFQEDEFNASYMAILISVVFIFPPTASESI